MPSDINLRLDDMRQELSIRVDAASAHVDGLREELASCSDGPSRRIIEAEIGTAAAMVDLAGAVRDLVTALREQFVTAP